MATGVASGAWGYSPQMIAGMDYPMEMYGRNLTYQLGLNSVISPLYAANAKYYQTGGSQSSYGTHHKKKKKKSKSSFGACDYSESDCTQFVQSNGTFNPHTGRMIDRYGPTFQNIARQCNKYPQYNGQFLERVICDQSSGSPDCPQRPFTRSQGTCPPPLPPRPGCPPQPCQLARGRKKCDDYSSIQGLDAKNCASKKDDKYITITNGSNTMNFTKKLNAGTGFKNEAYYGPGDSDKGKIIAMGCTQVTILGADNKQKRVCIKDFHDFNVNRLSSGGLFGR
jgi:hypothetical protein